MVKECAGRPCAHRLQLTMLQHSRLHAHRLQRSRLRAHTVQPALCGYTICSVGCSHCAAQHAACPLCAAQHMACSQAAAQHRSHCAAARSRDPFAFFCHGLQENVLSVIDRSYSTNTIIHHQKQPSQHTNCNMNKDSSNRDDHYS